MITNPPRRTRLPAMVGGLLALLMLVAACEADEDAPDAAEEPAADPGEPEEVDEEADDADDVAEADFSGETVEILVPFSEGGGTDTFARLLAPYLSEQLSGEPAVQVVNVTGGGGLAGSNQYALRDADGTNLMMSANSTHYPYVLDDPAVEYDLADFVPVLGLPGGAAVYVSPDTGVEEPADLTDPDEPLVYGGIGATATDLAPIVAFELLELDVQETLGYEGRGAAGVAFEQGEINVDMQFSAAYASAVEPLVEAGEAIPLFSMGQMEGDELVRDPAFPDLPTVEEVYEEIHGESPSGEVWDAYRTLALSGFTLNWVLWVHADAPQERIDALAAAGEELAGSEEFLEAGADVMDHDLLTGDELTAQVDAVLSAPDEVVSWLRTYLVEEHDVDRLAD